MSIDASLPPRRQPTGNDWTLDLVTSTWTRWIHRTGIVVTSSVDLIEDDGPTVHVSVSFQGGRASRAVVRKVREDFAMQAAEEDNHAPGRVIRSLWLPVNRDVGQCPCVDEPREERPFGSTEDDGDVHVYREAKL